MLLYSYRSSYKSRWLLPGDVRPGLCHNALVKEAPVSSQQDTITALMEKSLRSEFVSIRRLFVQQGRRSTLRPCPLNVFVRHHDERGLDLYLLTRLLASHTPFEAHQPAAVWARALGLQGSAGINAVSRAWKRLADLRLIDRGRRGRDAVVTVLLEDGSGSPFVQFGARGDAYFKIPLEYWRDEWYRRLDLPAKALLLIALSLPDGFYLPMEWASRWYGISADTAERGLTTLRSVGLLGRESHYKKAPLTAAGYTREYQYELRPPFGPRWAQAVAPAPSQEVVPLKIVS